MKIFLGIVLMSTFIVNDSKERDKEIIEIENFLKSARALIPSGRYDDVVTSSNQLLESSKLWHDHKSLARSQALTILAVIHMERGNFSEAEAFIKGAYVAMINCGEDAKASSLLINIAAIESNIAQLYIDKNNLIEAEKYAILSLRHKQEITEQYNDKIRSRYHVLFHIYVSQHDYAKAEPWMRQLLDIQEKTLDAHHLEVSKTLVLLATVLDDQAKYAEAEHLCRRALAIQEKALGSDSPEIATILEKLASVLFKQEKYAEAGVLARRLLAIKERALGAKSPQLVPLLKSLLELALKQDHPNFVEAEHWARRLLVIQEKALGVDSREVATILGNLASALFEQKKYAEAEPLGRRALGIQEKAVGADSPELLPFLQLMGDLAGKMGHRRDAVDFRRRAKYILRSISQ
jgi:tetratricopeptide (TPR) repeat protein